MRTDVRNIVATVLVALILVPYLGYLVWGEMPLLQDPRGMGATGLILGLAAAAVVGRAALDPAPLSRAALGAGAVALVLGVATVWAETNEGLLAVFMAAIAVTWALGQASYLGASQAPAESTATMR